MFLSEQKGKFIISYKSHNGAKDGKGMRFNSGKSHMSLMRNLDFTSCL